MGVLGASFTLPGLECFGNVSTDIKRLGVVYVPNGINMNYWTPKHYGDIMNMPGSLSPMQDHKDYMSIISGLTHDKARANGDGAGDHARAAGGDPHHCRLCTASVGSRPGACLLYTSPSPRDRG